MDAVRDVCSAALSIRKETKRRVRLPLARLTVAYEDSASLAPYVALIADEVNVKDVVLDRSATVEKVLRLKPAVLGPRVGPDVQKLLRAAKEGDYEETADGVVVAGRLMAEDEYELALSGGGPDVRVVPGTSIVVTLDTEVTPELEAEGLARDVARGLNDARKAAGLAITDRVRAVVEAHHDDVREAVRTHADFIRAEVLATELDVADEARHHLADAQRLELADGRALHLSVVKV
jgi:isoleucyl-tRNA synthetase